MLGLVSGTSFSRPSCHSPITLPMMVSYPISSGFSNWKDIMEKIKFLEVHCCQATKPSFTWWSELILFERNSLDGYLDGHEGGVALFK